MNRKKVMVFITSLLMLALLSSSMEMTFAKYAKTIKAEPITLTVLPDEFAVELDANGGNFGYSSDGSEIYALKVRNYYMSETPYNFTLPERDGYVFAGWYSSTESNSSSEHVPTSGTFTFTSSVATPKNLYAHWGKKFVHSITSDENNYGAFSNIVPKSASTEILVHENALRMVCVDESSSDSPSASDVGAIIKFSTPLNHMLAKYMVVSYNADNTLFGSNDDEVMTIYPYIKNGKKENGPSEDRKVSASYHKNSEGGKISTSIFDLTSITEKFNTHTITGLQIDYYNTSNEDYEDYSDYIGQYVDIYSISFFQTLDEANEAVKQIEGRFQEKFYRRMTLEEIVTNNPDNSGEPDYIKDYITYDDYVGAYKDAVPGDYVRTISYEAASSFTLLPMVASEITLDHTNIDPINLEWWPVENQQVYDTFGYEGINAQFPYAGFDYSLQFELYDPDTYALPEYITVQIDDQVYDVATNGSALENEPFFNTLTSTLTIPAALLTEETQNVSVALTAVSTVEKAPAVCECHYLCEEGFPNPDCELCQEGYDCEGMFCICDFLCTDQSLHDTCELCKEEPGKCEGVVCTCQYHCTDTFGDENCAACALGSDRCVGEVCICLPLCENGLQNTDCPVCQDAPSRCEGLTCSCDIGCIGGEVNNDCALCVKDDSEHTLCVGVVCTCDKHCTSDNQNDDCGLCTMSEHFCIIPPECTCVLLCDGNGMMEYCEACVEDITACNGHVCECEFLCDGAPNKDCRVCKHEMRLCQGGEPPETQPETEPEPETELETDAPVDTTPDTSESEEPETNATPEPETEVTAPESTETEASTESETTAPESTEPESTELEATDTDTTEPEDTESETAEPASPETETTASETTEADPVEPDVPEEDPTPVDEPAQDAA